MTPVVLIHGVPDTPFMWGPLIEALDLPDEAVVTPALPGFVDPPPADFPSTKEAYTDWLIEQIAAVADQHKGKVHVIGHDWGAVLTLRIASLRPDLFETWTVANAVIDPDYRGHRMAKIWATPILGEIAMALAPAKRMAPALADLGMPEAVAGHEARFWSSSMKKAILRLYRSAKGLSFRGEWVEDLENLPERGLVLWGETDPFVDLSVAKRFHARWGFPLQVIEDTGHWGLIEAPGIAAQHIKAHWAGNGEIPADPTL